LEAEAAVRARDQFLTVAAHELKTPLTSLLGRAQVALRRLERDGRLEPNEARRALESINAQAVRSSRLVGQLFDVAALEAGQLELHLEPVDLGGLARRAVASTETLSPAHTVRVLERAKPAEPAEPAHHPGTHDMRGASAGSFLVAGDRDRLEQVLHNLLENAVKYSPEGGEVTVALEHVESGDVRLTVTDRGLGVPPEHRPHIFDRYYQAHGGEHRSGMGLGLYVSRQIVERHGGRIEAQFPPEGGTRIVITLPAARDTAAEGTPPLGAKEGPPA
jgi:signal transduction histidine kinase